mmetsp:Transcript_25381/g.61024  ORF Transcript_25381/g.61024 Transcript_25381/m.61024 type:complete len:212 (-) Transcript_25381:226-861(-)|eukprot:CAMPEP_0181087980 /NCGR_PEP_ID=MMETSP1071-20121207/6549_1 /TAXON_ID=35127 /ORGANISM="Thalassiosira sp., Strain NH16" /LENGTH=211 /DNA_ID=CAMNT_0023169879 /DNA_START=121 /DNA_END=756 /DNA_ORIENTATION=-
MSASYAGFAKEQRDDFSCGRDTSIPITAVSSVGARGGPAIKPTGRTRIGAISKDVIRTFQTTIQNNGRSHQMMPQNAPVSHIIKPPLQKVASEGSRIVHSMQNMAVMGGVSEKLSSVNGKIGSMLRRSSMGPNFPVTQNSSDRGIYSSESMRSWGSSVSAEISSFTTRKVVPIFKRQNTYPYVGSENDSRKSNMKGANEVSFDYQLMKDNE